MGNCCSPMINNFFSLETTVDNKILEIRCTCGNSVQVVGNERGWVFEFNSPPVFKCPCGKIITFETNFDDR